MNQNAGWKWGVDQVVLSSSPTVGNNLRVGGDASGKYGNKWGTLKDQDGIINFGFNVSDTSKDLNLKLNAYDIDSSDEVRIVLNGQIIDYLDRTADNSIAAQSFTISSSDLVTGVNQLGFMNQNAGWAWGVDSVALI